MGYGKVKGRENSVQSQPPTKCHSRKFGSYGPKTLKPVNFGQKWPNFGLNAQNFAISELSWRIEYDFLKEDQKNYFHTKN